MRNVQSLNAPTDQNFANGPNSSFDGKNLPNLSEGHAVPMSCRVVSRIASGTSMDRVWPSDAASKIHGAATVTDAVCDLVLAHYACAIDAGICLRTRADARGGNTSQAYARSAHVRRTGGKSDPASWGSAAGSRVGFRKDHRIICARSGTRDRAG